VPVYFGRLGKEASLCDFHAERFAAEGVPIERVTLNTEPLPYPDRMFDLITCSEVIEYLENSRPTAI
jgi:ubiquinone/menaquinone biosynthesis C-methylase UbiE